MRRKAGASLVLLLAAASAHANGAMWLGLEMWDLDYWFAYVVAMVALEAWLIGRWLKLSWTASILTSLCANLVTGLGLGFVVAGLFAPIFHQPYFGSFVNPNPFMNSVVLLLGFALPSAWIESMIWRRGRPKDQGMTIRRAIAVHLFTVPVGLVILLAPSHPYKGAEQTASVFRFFALMSNSGSVERFIASKDRLPNTADMRDIARDIAPYLRKPIEDVVAFYEPEFGRFSTGETWQRPFEVNAEIAGRRFEMPDGDAEEKWIWYVRRPYAPGRDHWGIVVDLTWGRARFTRKDEELGYGATSAPQ